MLLPPGERMWVVPVVLIFVTCLPGIFSAESKGQLFVTAFPENVAFYDQVPHSHVLFVMAAINNTWVTITVESVVKKSMVLNAGAVEEVTLETSVELQRSKFSQKSVVIRSTKDISVVSRSKRKDSQQYLTLQPVINLGPLYYIPVFLPNESSGNLMGFKDFHGARLKMVVINTERNNVVKVNFKEDSSEQQKLLPFQVLQLNISDSPPVRIAATNNVAVLLTHPCTNSTLCHCEMMMIQLQPANTWGTAFLVPSALNIAGGKNLIITSDQNVTLNAGFQSEYINSFRNASVMLSQPGYFIELIPESHFSACYLLHFKVLKALIIVPDKNKSQVHLGKDLISSSVPWNPVSAYQHYSWAVIDLAMGKQHVIWHPSTKIAVYVKYDGKWSEAISLSTEPDPQGCLIVRGGYTVIDQSGTWAETINYCQYHSGELVSINSEGILQELSRNISNPNNEKDVWVGLRRRLVNGEWYWLNKEPMNITKWVEGQPRSSQENFCASMSLSSNNGFRWRSHSCCHIMKPICYTKKSFFPVETI